ncbi:MAG: hypothetical protein Q8P67_05450 [archaeon]|nr:hypothetical protein [archaeon]
MLRGLLLFSALVAVCLLVPTNAQVTPVADCEDVFGCLTDLLTGSYIPAADPMADWLDDLVDSLNLVTSIDIVGNLASADTCPFPKCPEGYTISPNQVDQCKRTTSELKGDNTVNAYTSLEGCVTDTAVFRGVFGNSTYGTTSFRIRNCMQPFNKAYKDCLYKHGILG